MAAIVVRNTCCVVRFSLLLLFVGVFRHTLTIAPILFIVSLLDMQLHCVFIYSTKTTEFRESAFPTLKLGHLFGFSILIERLFNKELTFPIRLSIFAIFSNNLFVWFKYEFNSD